MYFVTVHPCLWHCDAITESGSLFQFEGSDSVSCSLSLLLSSVHLLFLCTSKGNAAKLTWGKPHHDTRFCYPKSVMGSEVSRSNTHVANATGKPIRVYYSVDKMRLEEIVQEIGAELGASSSKEVSGKISSSTKMVFKRDSLIRYIRIPVSDFCKFAGEGTIYASVFVESCSCSDEWEKTICLNFHVPGDRSFIVTENHNIRFQKYGASIWEDEHGVRHG